MATTTKLLSIPKCCEICKTSFDRIKNTNCYQPKVVVDGRWGNYMTMWVYMCWNCFNTNGVGLGVGRGQVYSIETGEQLKNKEEVYALKGAKKGDD